MELKVWVEGIQRIVCGVTEATTCQDVVYALAHATGKTGRFTLIERWRSNERLLPPQEHPLQVLSKWGEYANDVQLVLRHARDSSSCRATPDSIQNGVMSPQPLVNEASNLPTKTQPLPIRKSLTFSSGGNGREMNYTNCQTGGVNSDFQCQNNSVEHTFRDQSKLERRDWSDVPRGVVKGVPQQQQQQHRENQSDVTTQNSPIPNRTEQNSSEVFANYRLARTNEHESPSVKMGKGQPKRNLNTMINSPQAFVGQRLTNINHGNVAYSGSSPIQPSSINGGVSSVKHNGRTEQEKFVSNEENSSQDRPSGVQQQCPSLPRYAPPPPPPPTLVNNATSQSTSQQSPSYSPRSTAGIINPVPVHLGTPKSRRNLLCEFKRHDLEEELPEDFPLDPVGKQEKVIYDSRYRDLVRLINLQREKLSRQQTDLTQFDAEIAYWEEKQKDHQRQIHILECEIQKVELTECKIEEEVMQLDGIHLDNQLEIGRQQENMLSSELTLLRSKLSNCETELLQCKSKIRLVMDNISEDERCLSKEEDERRQREAYILNEIDVLQKDIQNTTTDYDCKVGYQLETCDKYEQDVKKLETTITDKKKQVENLVREMKEANLESLTFTPSEEIRQLLEGGVHKGPGSSRKIVGSPRQLENAVPTSKNPHGVWV